MADRDKPHIFVSTPALAEAYRPSSRGGTNTKPPLLNDPLSHGQKLRRELAAAEVKGRHRRGEQSIEVEGAIDGIYVSFESFPGIQLALNSLDPQQGKVHPELVEVRKIQSDDQMVEEATVFVPDGKLGYFRRRLDHYIETAVEENQRHRNLYNRVATIGLASVEQL